MKPLPLVVVAFLLVGCGAQPGIAQNGGDKKDESEGKSTVTPSNASTLELTQPAPDEAPVLDKEPAKENHVAGALLFGEYVGRIEFPEGFFEEMKKQAEENGTLEEAVNFEKGIKESKLRLQLGQDGVYTISSTTMGVSETRSGDWTYDPSKQLLTIKKSGDEPNAKDKVFVVDDSGRKLVFVGENEGVRVTITFTRS